MKRIDSIVSKVAPVDQKLPEKTSPDSSKSTGVLVWAFVATVVLAPTFSCGRQAPPRFDTGLAWAHLMAQCAYGPRVPGSPARDSVAVYIARRAEAAGADVSLQRFRVADPYADRDIPLVNVLANFYPDESRRVMLAAHYDSRPRADEEADSVLQDQPILGANDGASGVAVLLEIARIVGGRAPDGIGVDLVFFDGEDYGKKEDLEYYLLGSKYFVRALPGYRPVCGVLLDMIGGKGISIAREANSQAAAGVVVDDLFERALSLGLDVFVNVAGPPIYDDHIPFLRAGIPVVDLFGYDYAQWHTHADVPENCSRHHLEQVGTLLVDFLYDFRYDG